MSVGWSDAQVRFLEGGQVWEIVADEGDGPFAQSVPGADIGHDHGLVVGPT